VTRATSLNLPARKLSVREAAAHLNVSKSWLDKRRLDGNGPRYLKMSRRVAYDLADLEAFAAKMKRQHTSEPSSNGQLSV
jgi:predicted DNA-binding transcriptional regulator AlpA